MADYRLHCFAQSGNAYKAALTLALAGADWEPVFVDFFNGETRSAGYRARNEMGEAPVLEHAGLTLSQSGVILDYLSGQLGGFGPESEAERLEILRWILWDNHKFTSYTATLRFLRTFLPEAQRDPAVIAWLETRALAAWKVLDSHLASRDFIVAGRLTTADLSCAGYVFYADEIGFDTGAFPAIARWREAIAALPGWQHPYDLMPGHPLQR